MCLKVEVYSTSDVGTIFCWGCVVNIWAGTTQPGILYKLKIILKLSWPLLCQKWPSTKNCLHRPVYIRLQLFYINIATIVSNEVFVVYTISLIHTSTSKSLCMAHRNKIDEAMASQKLFLSVPCFDCIVTLTLFPCSSLVQQTEQCSTSWKGAAKLHQPNSIYTLKTL